MEGTGEFNGSGRLPLGVVLCGGESKRMGRDKGLLLENGRPWCRIAFDLLASLLPRVVVSIHPHQRSQYEAHFAPEQLVEDRYPRMGPLGGLLSVHDSFPQEDLAVLACDMIRMERGLYGRLLALAYGRGDMADEQDGSDGFAKREGRCSLLHASAIGDLEDLPGMISLDAALFVTRGGPEPLAAIYKRSFLGFLGEKRAKGELENYSLRRVLQGRGVLFLEVSGGEERALSNFNSPEEWKGGVRPEGFEPSTF